jgi:hypothetical protein
MNPHGNGLGLSICKTIATAMKGDLQATSELGIGSCFTFTLNLKRSEKKSKKSRTTTNESTILNTSNNGSVYINLKSIDLSQQSGTI